ncbi:MAG: hypothetical protein LBQ54_03170 [Planctomycetaceae bacterium]|jgi:hypothetical protein|nr:hypothetical protein [Planctomycetaceae bacterium]
MSALRHIPRSPLFWILLFVIVYWSVPFRQLHRPRLATDSASYLEVSQKIPAILSGDVDIERTPVYPAFLALHRLLFGEQYYLYWVFHSQQLIILIAIIVFYHLTGSLLKNKILAAFATFCFAVHPHLIIYNISILTESLSISCLIFFVYLLVIYYRKPTFLKAFLSGFGVFLLIMLRPAFLILLPIFILFWTCRLLFVHETRKKDVVGLITIFVAFGLVLGYCYQVDKKCGIFNLTIASAFNQFHCVVQSGLYQNGSDSKINRLIIQTIEEFKREYPDKLKDPNWLLAAHGMGDESDPLLYLRESWKRNGIELSHEQKNLYAIQTIKANKPAYIKYLFQKIIFLKGVGYPIKFMYVYILLLLNFFLIFASLKRYSWSEIILHITLFLIPAGAYFTAIAGSHAEYERLVLPVFPLVVLLLFFVIDHFTRWQFVHDEISGRRKITVDILLQK